jgi:hypothetical protein
VSYMKRPDQTGAVVEEQKPGCGRVGAPKKMISYWTTCEMFIQLTGFFSYLISDDRGGSLLPKLLT